MMTEAHNRYDSYRGVPVAVLGASGFIGRWVAGALSAQGAKLYLIVRDAAAAERIFSRHNVQGKIVEVDLSDAVALRTLFGKIRPSITFNLAGYGVKPGERQEEGFHQINTSLVETICEAIAQRCDPTWEGQDLIHVGSALEYGAIGGNLCEDSIPNPTTTYGKSKLKGTEALESCCEALGIKGLAARLFTVYGPGEHPGRLLPSLLDTARTGKSLRLTSGRQKRDFTYVEDVAEGLLRLGLVKDKPEKTVNLSTGHLTTVRRFSETVAKIVQIPYDRLEFGTIPTREEEMEHESVAVGRLRQMISWVPPLGIEQGIRRTVEFENRHAADIMESRDLTYTNSV